MIGVQHGREGREILVYDEAAEITRQQFESLRARAKEFDLRRGRVHPVMFYKGPLKQLLLAVAKVRRTETLNRLARIW